ncbi:hypothetical protein [Streptomyces goshikiensis]|uniref:hypothetical protein n=1 Tax=Streptomyces goshikiensis TaxID=1942 RepID=UPI0036948689
MNTRHGDDTSHHLPWAEHTVNALNANDLARKPAQRRAKPFTYRLVRTESTAAAPESG